MAYDQMTALALDHFDGDKACVLATLHNIREPSPAFLAYTQIDADLWKEAIDYLLNPYARGDG